MGRAPCCEKMGLKKGPWTREEDQILISYVQRFGHSNWRALPRQAGLLRCGKSCRLRWINYLRPGIKRGNFTREEEEMIIELHQVLGNRWSAIAAKLPGRTDNEIKNVWHTHLKKRLPLLNHHHHHQQSSAAEDGATTTGTQHPSKPVELSKKESEPENEPDSSASPQYSTTTSTANKDRHNASENFWAQVLSRNQNAAFYAPVGSGVEFQTLSQPARVPEFDAEAMHGVRDDDDRGFWCNLLARVGEFPELLEM